MAVEPQSTEQWRQRVFLLPKRCLLSGSKCNSSRRHTHPAASAAPVAHASRPGRDVEEVQAITQTTSVNRIARTVTTFTAPKVGRLLSATEIALYACSDRNSSVIRAFRSGALAQKARKAFHSAQRLNTPTDEYLTHLWVRCFWE